MHYLIGRHNFKKGCELKNRHLLQHAWWFPGQENLPTRHSSRGALHIEHFLSPSSVLCTWFSQVKHWARTSPVPSNLSNCSWASVLRLKGTPDHNSAVTLLLHWTVNPSLFPLRENQKERLKSPFKWLKCTLLWNHKKKANLSLLLINLSYNN